MVKVVSPQSVQARRTELIQSTQASTASLNNESSGSNDNKNINKNNRQKKQF